MHPTLLLFLGVLLLGVLETVLRWIDFSSWNAGGIRNIALLGAGVTLLSLKKVGPAVLFKFEFMCLCAYVLMYSFGLRFNLQHLW